MSCIFINNICESWQNAALGNWQRFVIMAWWLSYLMYGKMNSKFNKWLFYKDHLGIHVQWKRRKSFRQTGNLLGVPGVQGAICTAKTTSQATLNVAHTRYTSQHPNLDPDNLGATGYWIPSSTTSEIKQFICTHGLLIIYIIQAAGGIIIGAESHTAVWYIHKWYI